MKRTCLSLFFFVCVYSISICMITYPVDSLDNGLNKAYVNRIWPLVKDENYRKYVEKYMITDVVVLQDTLMVFTSTPRLFNNDVYRIPNRQALVETFHDAIHEYWNEDLPHSALIRDNYGDTLIYHCLPWADVEYELYTGILYTNNLYTFSRDFRIGVETEKFFKYLGLNEILKDWEIPRRFYIVFILNRIYDNFTKPRNETDYLCPICVRIENGQIYSIKFLCNCGIFGIQTTILLL